MAWCQNHTHTHTCKDTLTLQQVSLQASELYSVSMTSYNTSVVHYFVSCNSILIWRQLHCTHTLRYVCCTHMHMHIHMHSHMHNAFLMRNAEGGFGWQAVQRHLRSSQGGETRDRHFSSSLSFMFRADPLCAFIICNGDWN